MSTRQHAAPRIYGTNAERVAYSASKLVLGTLWIETDTDGVIIWDGDSWGTNFVTADEAWIGLAVDKGRVVFTDAATDTIVFKDCNVGIRTTPDDTLHVLSTTAWGGILLEQQLETNQAPYFLFFKSRTGGACVNNDYIGGFEARFYNSTPALISGGGMAIRVTDVTADSEDVSIIFSARGGGAWNALMIMEGGGNVVIGTAAALGKMHIDQSSATAAIPVVVFDQADVSEEMFEFISTIGVGNAIEAVGGKTLTTTHFIKVTLPGPLTRYLPVGTIA